MPSPLQGVEVGSTESLPTPFRFAVARFSAFHSMPEPPTTPLPTALLDCRMARAAGGARLRRAHINVPKGRVSTFPSPPLFNARDGPVRALIGGDEGGLFHDGQIGEVDGRDRLAVLVFFVGGIPGHD